MFWAIFSFSDKSHTVTHTHRKWKTFRSAKKLENIFFSWRHLNLQRISTRFYGFTVGPSGNRARSLMTPKNAMKCNAKKKAKFQPPELLMILPGSLDFEPSPPLADCSATCALSSQLLASAAMNFSVLLSWNAEPEPKGDDPRRTKPY